MIKFYFAKPGPQLRFWRIQ